MLAREGGTDITRQRLPDRGPAERGASDRMHVDLDAFRNAMAETAGPGVSDSIVQAFIGSGSEHRRATREAHTRADLKALSMAAHTLKSNAQLLEARRLAELSRVLEAARAAGDSVTAAGLVEPACDELDYVLAHMSDAIVETAAQVLHAVALPRSSLMAVPLSAPTHASPLPSHCILSRCVFAERRERIGDR